MSTPFVRGMEKACKLAAQVLEKTGKLAVSGITTNQLNDYADEITKTAGGISAPLGYHGFPKAICTSINDVLCHGVPNDVPLVNGDIINIDITVIVDGYHGDCSATYLIGPGPEPKLISAAREAMMAGIQMVRPGAHTGDIGWASEWAAFNNGHTAIPDIGGHGIGKQFHMAPNIPATGFFGDGEILRPNTCITVEPIVTEGKPGYFSVAIPNSTIFYYKTRDRSRTAQFEHTILITSKGYVILTQP